MNGTRSKRLSAASNKLGSTPPTVNPKSGRDRRNRSPSPPLLRYSPLRFSSVRLNQVQHKPLDCVPHKCLDYVSPKPLDYVPPKSHNYVSPLGNIAGSKKEKKDTLPSKRKRDLSKPNMSKSDIRTMALGNIAGSKKDTLPSKQKQKRDLNKPNMSRSEIRTMALGNIAGSKKDTLPSKQVGLSKKQSKPNMSNSEIRTMVLNNIAESKKEKKDTLPLKQTNMSRSEIRTMVLGNIAGSEIDTLPSEQIQECDLKNMSKSEIRSMRRKNRKIKLRAVEKIVSEVLGDIPLQSPPLEVATPIRETPEYIEILNEVLGAMASQCPPSEVATPITETPDCNKFRDGISRVSSAAAVANNTILIPDSPSNVNSDISSNLAAQSSTSTDNDDGIRDESKKRKNLENAPDVTMEIPSLVGVMASPAEKCQDDSDITEITPYKATRFSLPNKKRKVELDVGYGRDKTLLVTVSNEVNETIDLDSEEEDMDVSVTVLSDDDDDSADDVIVLGSPVVPTQRGPSRNPKPPARRGDEKRPAISPSIIERAITELKMKPSGVTLLVGAPLPSSPASVYGRNLYNPGTRFEQKGSRPIVVTASSSSSTVGAPLPSSPASVYGGNLYNPGARPEQTGLRPIIIDASNVAMRHGNGNVFSCRGIEICVNYFVKRKHKVFAFLPMFRRHSMHSKDAYLLDKLQSEKTLIFTPSRFVDGQSDVPYDDRYIVQTAAELGGVIVSTDNYRDLLQENPNWHDTIKNRLLMFTWVEDLLIFPQDPLGRRGCKLEEFLRF